MSVRQLTQRIRKPGDPARIATAEALEQIQASLDELKSDLDAIVAGTTSIEGLLSIPEYGLRGVSVSSVVPTYADADDNGDIDVILTVTYSPPSPIDTFDRVLVFVEKPTGEIIPIGEFLYPETAGGGSDSFEFFLPPPTVQEQWRVYLVSGSPSYVNELVLYGQLNASPSYLVTVDPIPEGASGSEWAPNVTSPSATVEYAIDQVGGLMWRVYGSFTPPSDPEYRGVRIVGRDPGGKDHQLSVEPYNATAYISSWRQVPDTSES
ncbi:MAG: hypothetical protein GWO24_37785, partial [Akkermansiaceae bacterium]|nr:hypothetical protein [Akkermansiaceae bacterium]